ELIVNHVDMLINEPAVVNKKLNSKEKNTIKGNASEQENIPEKENEPVTDADKKLQLENSEILSRSKLISSESSNAFFDDKNLEHFVYSDVHIVNVGVSRATLDMASKFNK